MPSLLRSGVELAAGIDALFVIMALYITFTGLPVGGGILTAVLVLVFGVLLWVAYEMSPRTIDWTEVMLTVVGGGFMTLGLLLMLYSSLNLGVILISFVVLVLPGLIAWLWTFKRDSFVLGGNSSMTA